MNPSFKKSLMAFVISGIFAVPAANASGIPVPFGQGFNEYMETMAPYYRGMQQYGPWGAIDYLIPGFSEVLPTIWNDV